MTPRARPRNMITLVNCMLTSRINFLMEEVGRKHMEDLTLIELWSDGGETEAGLHLDLYFLSSPANVRTRLGHFLPKPRPSILQLRRITQSPHVHPFPLQAEKPTFQNGAQSMIPESENNRDCKKLSK